MPGATTLDRIIVAAVSLLIAAFAFGAMSVLVTPALADDTAGKRDDDAFELVAKDDDDDDDDTGGGDTDTNGGSGGGDSNSNSKTGTTRGTGKSNSKSNTGARQRRLGWRLEFQQQDRDHPWHRQEQVEEQHELTQVRCGRAGPLAPCGLARLAAKGH